MSSKVGRNAPCPCGSGKKYKRCCLAADEAAARERVQQELLDDDFDLATDEEEDEEEFFDVEDEGSWLDVRDIVRVCYTRGFVRKISDLRSGRNLQVTEWSAPDIPSAILESVEREAVDALEGEWGYPKAADPIEVDIIDLETEIDVVTIQVFNRGLSLISTDNEQLRRIHRVCGALERASAGEPATEPGT